MMSNLYRNPQVEEGIRNMILQNRCGNTLTLMFHADCTELELVYRPNAYRYKDANRRFFSNRDVYTKAFKRLELPEINAEMVTDFGYDPFHTRVDFQQTALARNSFSLLSLADENAFALSAPAPLLITFLPYTSYVAEDGFLHEEFVDRGERVIPYVIFSGFRTNRFRVLDDGRHVLQLFENEAVIFGVEDNMGDVQRIRKKFSLVMGDLVQRNEQILKPVLNRGALDLPKDNDLQRVMDINRRMLWSALDEGGVCYGAQCRIYFLTWVRDGSMSNACMARIGMPDPLKRWVGLLLENPSKRMDPATGKQVVEQMQLVGTRWNKTEDDGIYYAVLSLYFHVVCSGSPDSTLEQYLQSLLNQFQRVMDSRFDKDVGLFGSDTLGEDTLPSSPYYGYDIVNGTVSESTSVIQNDGNPLVRAWTLYQNMNMYNALRMLMKLVDYLGNPEMQERYRELMDFTGNFEKKILSSFVGPDGEYLSMKTRYGDGTERWIPYGLGVDYWEHAWAISTGPFFPSLSVSLKSVRTVVQKWPTIRNIGYCPWNYLASFLREFGGGSKKFRDFLVEEVEDALSLTKKYAMPGLVTEYQKDRGGWRGLPFGVGSLHLAVSKELLSVGAASLVVRAGGIVKSTRDFVWRNSIFDVACEGEGDSVRSMTLNGETIRHTLCIPADRIRPGKNRLQVQAGESAKECRLYSTDAELLALSERKEETVLVLEGSHSIQCVIEGFDRNRVAVRNPLTGNSIAFSVEAIPGTELYVIRTNGGWIQLVFSGSSSNPDLV